MLFEVKFDKGRILNGRFDYDLRQIPWIVFVNVTLTMTSAGTFVANIDQKIAVAKRRLVLSEKNKCKEFIFA